MKNPQSWLQKKKHTTKNKNKKKTIVLIKKKNPVVNVYRIKSKKQKGEKNAYAVACLGELT
jgi:hypothetical protein